MDYYTKESRGFGYIEFYEREDAEAAYDRRRDIIIRRKPVTIEFARGQRKSKSSREMRVNDSDTQTKRRSPSPRRRHRSRSRSRRHRSRSRSRSGSRTSTRSRRRGDREPPAEAGARSKAAPADGREGTRTPSPQRTPEWDDDDSAGQQKTGFAAPIDMSDADAEGSLESF
ncbi:hypothetical protein IWW56_002962 [Coemansia sp. RSA 2131]|nr:hypothetical protein IWW56_002962 [Coemansia sp. RSA 2131]